MLVVSRTGSMFVDDQAPLDKGGVMKVNTGFGNEDKTSRIRYKNVKDCDRAKV